MNLTPQQQKKLEKIKKLLDGGNVGIITYLLDLEDKLENDLPTVTDLISRLKGDKGDNYTITQSDIKSIAGQARGLLNDEDIAEKVLNRLSLKEIAKIASSFIKVPKPKEVDVKKLKSVLKQEILDELPEPKHGEKGKDADEEAIIEKIEKDLEEDLPKFGYQFRDGLELLQGEDRLDKKAIQGLDDYDEISRLAKLPRGGGGGKQNLYQLNDVNIQDPTNNQVLKYNSTTGLWENGTGGGGGLDSFTSPDSTITIGGTLTDPTVDINLSNANTWSATQSFGIVNIAGNLAVDTNVLFVDTTNNRVGINISSPTSDLHLNSSSASAVNTQYTNSTTGSTSGDGTLVGITSAGVFEINQRENQVMNFYTNNTVGMTINTSQQVLITGGTVSAPSLAIGGDADTGMYRWNATSNHLGFAAGGAVGLIVGHSNGTPYVSVSSDATRIGNLVKFNVGGTGSGGDSPVIGIKNSSETTTGKNGGFFTQTRMTNNYLQTTQNLGFNDNSFGNPGVIQWTAWEYSNNTYTTLVTPTEFTGWSYQYYNGSAYKNLLRIHTSGIYINALNAAAVPAARLHVNSTTTSAGTPGTEDAFVIGRTLNSNVSYQQVATFAIGTYSTNSIANSYGPDTRLDLKLKRSSSDNFTSNVTVMTWLDTGAIGAGVTDPSALVDIAGSTTGIASLKIRAGTAPFAPNDGDIWFDGTDIKMRVAGVTKTFTLV